MTHDHQKGASVKITFQTDCTADVRETWTAEVPDGLADDELRNALMECVWGGDANFESEQISNETDRSFNRILL